MIEKSLDFKGGKEAVRLLRNDTCNIDKHKMKGSKRVDCDECVAFIFDTVAAVSAMEAVDKCIDITMETLKPEGAPKDRLLQEFATKIPNDTLKVLFSIIGSAKKVIVGEIKGVFPIDKFKEIRNEMTHAIDERQKAQHEQN